MTREEMARFQVRFLRSKGIPIYEIAQTFNVSLSEVRRFLDPKAERAHRRWRAR